MERVVAGEALPYSAPVHGDALNLSADARDRSQGHAPGHLVPGREARARERRHARTRPPERGRDRRPGASAGIPGRAHGHAVPRERRVVLRLRRQGRPLRPRGRGCNLRGAGACDRRVRGPWHCRPRPRGRAAQARGSVGLSARPRGQSAHHESGHRSRRRARGDRDVAGLGACARQIRRCLGVARRHPGRSHPGPESAALRTPRAHRGCFRGDGRIFGDAGRSQREGLRRARAPSCARRGRPRRLSAAHRSQPGGRGGDRQGRRPRGRHVAPSRRDRHDRGHARAAAAIACLSGRGEGGARHPDPSRARRRSST